MRKTFEQLLPDFVAAEKDAEAKAARKTRVDDDLVPEFNGAIKYTPMLQDHPEWTKEQCIEFAQKWHAVAIERLKADPYTWNEGIPYCRNIPTDEMKSEAGMVVEVAVDAEYTAEGGK